MIDRYTRAEMAALWTPASRFQRWLDIELHALDAMAELNMAPAGAARLCRERAVIDPRRIEELEAEVKHDVIAFLMQLEERIGPEARFLHQGMTSSDILDTAFATQLVDAASIILKDMAALLEVLKEQAFRHKRTVMVGRSHGIHAEPISLGLVFANWYAETGRNHERIERARETVRVGKISGAVGTFAHIPPAVEHYVCEKLGLEAAPVSSQIIQRDRHGEYFAALALCASSLEKFAVQIRHLQRTEVGEVAESFGKSQRGSSAMPHKRNPILSENVSGLARLVRAYSDAAMENIALWHERDISHSSAERVLAPDATITLDFMLHRFTRVAKGLDVYPQTMARNLELTGGRIYSQAVLLALVSKAMPRAEAYRAVQRCAHGAGSFKDALEKDEKVGQALSSEELDRCFDPNRYLEHVDTIFERVFQGSD